jgi:hypothetical protein
MKLVTLDYGCGTSSSILDYGIEDVILVSEDNYSHVFDAEDDLFFIGHDFLMFLWDTQDKVDRWKKFQYQKVVWCFERIDAIVPIWQQKSHYSISMIKQFADKIYACDEDDCDKYGYEWFPQWASCRFYEKKDTTPILWNNILFSGQAGKPEYASRNEFVQQVLKDPDLANSLRLTNTTRVLTWDEYVHNLLSHSAVLNPVGILKGFNTRAYEVLYSGRMLLQHTYGNYKRHFEMISDCQNVIHFTGLQGLKAGLSNISLDAKDTSNFYTKNNLFARFSSKGLSIR